jgi:hypothetical protein
MQANVVTGRKVPLPAVSRCSEKPFALLRFITSPTLVTAERKDPLVFALQAYAQPWTAFRSRTHRINSMSVTRGENYSYRSATIGSRHDAR